MESNKPKVKISYETLWKFIIRPPKDDYTEDLLGSPYFSYRGKEYVRKDYYLISSQGYNMKVSFVEPAPSSRPSKIMPVLIYLHGNSSSRIEGMNTLKELLKRDINVCVFDFPGCGLSEGDYISLGYHEADDVKIIVDFVDNMPGVGNIGLWGRSMGAATTMIYAHHDPRIKAIVMDSPFSNFNHLAKELVQKQINLPSFMIEGAIKIVRLTILKKNGLDINKLRPIDAAPKTFQPAMFIHALNDELINNYHSKELIENYGGEYKILKKCEGGHNTRRPAKLIKEIGNFLYTFLVVDSFDDGIAGSGEVKTPPPVDLFQGFANDNNKKEEKKDDNNIENETRSSENIQNGKEDVTYEESGIVEGNEKKKEEMTKSQLEEMKGILLGMNTNELQNEIQNIDVNKDFEQKEKNGK